MKNKFVEKLSGLLRLNDSFDDDYDTSYEQQSDEIEDPYYGTDYVEGTSARKLQPQPGSKHRNKEYKPLETSPTRQLNKSRSVATVTDMEYNGGYHDNVEVCMVRGDSFDTSVDPMTNARTIAQILLDHKVLLLNLEDVGERDAQRTVDFVSGACFAVDGSMQRISGRIFIVAPAGVYLSGDMLLAADNRFGQAESFIQPITSRRNV